MKRCVMAREQCVVAYSVLVDGAGINRAQHFVPAVRRAEAAGNLPVSQTSMSVVGSSLESQPSASTSKASRGPCVISAEQARFIFLARQQKLCARNLAARIAPQVGISSKAVRDIWSLRTWTHVTRAHWTPADHDRYTKKQHKLKQHAKFSWHIESTSSGSVAGDGSDHSPGHVDSESEPVQLLPTLPSWRLLSSSALATMEDAMAFLDAESETESRRTSAAAQPVAFKQNALADHSTSYSMVSSADSAKKISIFTMGGEGPELTLCQN
jgi:hypothetical protein